MFALFANVALAVSATTCLKLAPDELRLTAFLLNAASFSLLPRMLAEFPLVVVHLTASMGVGLSALVLGYVVFEEVPPPHQWLGAGLFLCALLSLHGPSLFEPDA